MSFIKLEHCNIKYNNENISFSLYLLIMLEQKKYNLQESSDYISFFH